MTAQSVDTYLKTLDLTMTRHGFERNPQHSLYRRRTFSSTEFSRTITFCLVKYIPGNLTVAALESFSRKSFEFAAKNKGCCFNKLIVYPLLITDKATDEVRLFIAKYRPKHWSSYEFPVLVDLSSGEILFCRSTPVWGAVYYPGFRREATELFKPEGFSAPFTNREPLKRIFWGLLVIIFCLVGLLNSILDLNNELTLQKQGALTQAVITDTDIETHYAVLLRRRMKYRFKVNHESYWYDGSILRHYHSLIHKPDREPSVYWATISKPAWDQANELKRVEVLYLPSDPWINRPLAASEFSFSPLTTHVVGVVSFTLLIVAGAYMLVNAFP